MPVSATRATCPPRIRPPSKTQPRRPSPTAMPTRIGEALFNLDLGERRLQLRTLSHARMELRPARRVRPGCLRLEPHRRLGQLALRRRRTVGGVFEERFGVRQALWSQRPGKWPDARIRIVAHRRADPRDRRIRTELVTMTLVGNRLGARTPRSPHRHHRCRHPLRQRVRHHGHQHGNASGVPRGGRRVGRLDDADGHRVDDLRHRPSGSRPHVAGGTRGRRIAGCQCARRGGRPRSECRRARRCHAGRVGRDRA